MSGYFTVAWSLADRFRGVGPWTNAELRALRTEEVADTLGQDRDHELMALYAQALRDLGRFLGERHALDLVAESGGSAATMARRLAGGMALYDDRGFWKRAQIVPSNLALAGVARVQRPRPPDDLRRQPRPPRAALRRRAALRTRARRAHRRRAAAASRAAGAGDPRVRGARLRAALRAHRAVAPRELDLRLWTRGQDPAIKARQRHRCRCVAY